LITRIGLTLSLILTTLLLTLIRVSIPLLSLGPADPLADTAVETA